LKCGGAFVDAAPTGVCHGQDDALALDACVAFVESGGWLGEFVRELRRQVIANCDVTSGSARADSVGEFGQGIPAAASICLPEAA
jgi:hypothetical protein